MHGGNARIVALQNRVNQLELELLQAKSAFSTLQAAFQELAHSVQLVNADPMNFTHTSITPATSSIKQLPPIDKMDFPDVRFWTRADWDKWQTTSQGLKQKGKRGPMAFLEDEDGEPITEELLDIIRKTIRGLWFEFGVKGLLATTWSKIIHSTRILFHSIMEERHPLFRLAMDGWKLDLLCSIAYPSWRKNHLDADGNLLKQSKKVKQEDNDIGYRGSTRRSRSPDFEGASASKRIKNDSTVPFTKVEDTSPLIVKGKSTKPLTVKSHSDGTLDPQPMLLEDSSATTSSDASLPLIATPIPPPFNKVEKENQPPTHACIVLTNPLITNHNTIHSAGLTRQPLVKSAVPTTTIVLDTPETVPSSKLAPVPTPTTGTTVLDTSETVPSSSLKLASVPTTTAVLDTSETIPNSKLVPVPTTTIVLNTSEAVLSSKLAPLSPSKNTDPINIPFLPGIPAALPQVNDATVPTTASSKKPVKMRPGPTKKGRNLCALRWLKQVTPGSTNEFNAYYSRLNETQIQSYDREAKELEKEGRWTKNSEVVDGPMY
ncbi:hypothetical protein C8R48DRAFT_672543 [Suillus tomentosus]|nr:hypothetical protein C8R48DRAFT_672543 [Suillus tomentosus]